MKGVAVHIAENGCASGASSGGVQGWCAGDGGALTREMQIWCLVLLGNKRLSSRRAGTDLLDVWGACVFHACMCTFCAYVP